MTDSEIMDSRLLQSNVLEFLRTVPLFHDVHVNYVNILARYVKPEAFQAGELVLKEGVAAKDLLIVRDGTVSVFVTRRDEKIELTQLGERSYFGELAIFDEYPRSANVFAVTDVLAFRISKDNFRTVARAQPDVIWQMCKVFSHRLRSTNSVLTQR